MEPVTPDLQGKCIIHYTKATPIVNKVRLPGDKKYTRPLFITSEI